MAVGVERKRAIIVGGGIGGLSTAIGLKRAGWSVHVYERAPEIREIGAAVGTLPNGSAALAALGVLDAYREQAQYINAMLLVSASGEPLVDLRMGEVEQKVGYATYCIHRHEYIKILQSFLDPDEISTDHEFSRFEERGNEVVAHFLNGAEGVGDILIGADGYRSRVRQQLQQPHPRELRYCGYIGYRGVSTERPASLPPHERRLMLGAGLQFGYSPMTKGRCYWLATYNSPAGTYRSAEEIRELLLGELAKTAWLDLLAPLITTTPEDGFIQNDIYDYVPDPMWGRGRISLIGDAAHATSPNQGQGSNMAIEDAAAIAYHLKVDEDPVAALRSYEQARYERTKMIVEMSHNAGAQAAITDPAEVAQRDAFLRQIAPHIANDGLEKLYSYKSMALI